MSYTVDEIHALLRLYPTQVRDELPDRFVELREAMHKLPERLRQIAFLIAVNQLTQEEVSHTLGLPQPTVCRHYKEALCRLAVLMK
jgi:RNA polymerase sigma factor (sigma-70 family)